MKGLILVALVGFAIAITLAIPFTEDEIKAYSSHLGEIRNDVTERYVVLMLTLAEERKYSTDPMSFFFKSKGVAFLPIFVTKRTFYNLEDPDQRIYGT